MDFFVEFVEDFVADFVVEDSGIEVATPPLSFSLSLLSLLRISLLRFLVPGLVVNERGDEPKTMQRGTEKLVEI